MDAQVIDLELHVTGAEELEVHSRRVDLLRLEVLGHLEHELFRTADEVFGGAVADIKVLTVNLG